MTDLDELRRIAYGRTNTTDEEAAAALARVQLATHESERLDAARRVLDAEQRVEPAETPAVEEPDEPAEDTDEPGYLRRLAASWRAWIVPAAVAFVVGMGVAAASGLLIFDSMRFGDGSSAITPGTNTSERFKEGSTVVEIPEPVPGDVEAAREVLARAQVPEDIPATMGQDVNPESTRLIFAGATERAYAVSTDDYEFCLMAEDVTDGTTWMTCAPEENFALSSLSVGVLQSIGEKLTLLWDGASVVATRTTG